MRIALGFFAISALYLSCKSASVNMGESDVKLLDVSKKHESDTVIPIQNGNQEEYCIKIGGYPELGEKWEKKIFDAKAQDKLCELRFDIEKSSDQNFALCPKGYSTNPAIEVMDISTLKTKGVTRESYEDMSGYDYGCRRPQDREGKKLAKFKGTVTCSSTGSIVAAYYLGRLLDIGDVPAAVIRTIRADVMQDVTNRGLKTALKSSWQGWNSILAGVGNKELLDLNRTADGKFVYGALSENPRGESRYSEINMRSMSSFKNTPLVQKVFNSSDFKFSKNNLQDYGLIKQIEDVGDLIVFDTILGQQDRLGNIHARPFFYYDDNGKVEKSKKAPKDKKFVQVKRLMLKDNDCGLRSDSVNIIAEKLYKNINHMSPKTYRRLRWLAQEQKSGHLSKFVHDHSLRHDGGTAKSRWGITLAGRLRDGLKRMESDFYQRCKAGQLRLDLDANDIYENGMPSAEVLQARCDEIWDPANDTVATLAQAVFADGDSDSSAHGGGGSTPSTPNSCRTTSGVSGQCIEASKCVDQGKKFERGRCLRDGPGVFCCY